MHYTRRLLIMFAMLCCHQSYSRDIYLKPRIGVGVSGLNGSGLSVSKAGMATSAGVAGAYGIGNVRAGISLSALNMRYSVNDVLFEDQFDPQTGQVIPGKWDKKNIAYSDMQFIICATGGYMFLSGKKISVMPEVGLGMGYNAATTSKVVSQTTGEVYKSKMPAGVRRATFFYGQLSLHCIYNLNKRVGISLAPTYIYQGNPFSSFRPVGMYAVMGNVGLVLKMK